MQLRTGLGPPATLLLPAWPSLCKLPLEPGPSFTQAFEESIPATKAFTTLLMPGRAFLLIKIHSQKARGLCGQDLGGARETWALGLGLPAALCDLEPIR